MAFAAQQPLRQALPRAAADPEEEPRATALDRRGTRSALGARPRLPRLPVGRARRRRRRPLGHLHAAPLRHGPGEGVALPQSRLPGAARVGRRHRGVRHPAAARVPGGRARLAARRVGPLLDGGAEAVVAARGGGDNGGRHRRRDVQLRARGERLGDGGRGRGRGGGRAKCEYVGERGGRKRAPTKGDAGAAPALPRGVEARGGLVETGAAPARAGGRRGG
mmetsp:Transcript_40474/g.131462  ORF Transcript_40474/g.131462 Transcript_40474/m.131462 type:complete len:221 (+) Transcript_40474:598-1260(+)